jgi:hypothetical protein
VRILKVNTTEQSSSLVGWFIAGKKFTETVVLDRVSPEEFPRLKAQLSSAPETDFYTHWAKWFLAPPATRNISPFSSITVPEYVQRRIEENTLESLKEAAALSPANGLAYARLARQVLAQNETDNPRRIGEADFFSRFALKWAPNDAEVLKIRAEIESLIRQQGTP